MPLARAVALRNASTGAIATSSGTMGYDLGTLIDNATTQRLYAGLHLLAIRASSGGNTTQESFSVTIQSACTSAFASPTLEFTFTARSTPGAEWHSCNGNPVASTDRGWFRINWAQTTDVGEPTARFIGWVSIQ